MKETFDEYKETIERNLIKFSYLYDGDVISSTTEEYKEDIDNQTVSPSFIIRTFNHIYKKSFERMMSNSKEISISHDLSKLDLDGDKIFSIIDDLKIKPLYIFCSEQSKKRFGIIKSNSGPFPDYFYNIKTIYNKNYDLYYSPLIEESNDELILYISDSSMQSLVYSIQNMEYRINKKNHTIKYPFYECDFNSYKISIKDISKIRDEKIDSILF
jgi:hypothetical protein